MKWYLLDKTERLTVVDRLHIVRFRVFYSSGFSNENMQRREKCMAGTREMLLNGEWPTKPPFGYEITRKNGKREIVIAEKGKLLRRAFIKKIRYNTPFKELSIWLKSRGIKLSNKRLSDLSRNPFYCGFMAHSTLEGDVVKGNHEPLLTQKEFTKLNEVLLANNPNRVREHKREEDHLPLKGQLICSSCNTKMTGYVVKNKNLWYYKCNTRGCKGNTSAKTLHELWLEGLQSMQVDQQYAIALREHLRIKLDKEAKLTLKDVESIKKEKKTLQNKIDTLEERYALGEISRELYEKYLKRYKLELKPILEELEKTDNFLSNHEQMAKDTVETLCNLLKIWKESDLENKGSMIKAIYPRGLVYNKGKSNYLTENLNPAIRVIREMTVDSEQTKKRNKDENITYSALVEGSGIK